MDSFEIEIRTLFLAEALEMLEDVESSFMDLEQGRDTDKVVDKIFRLAHNLKGSAKAVGYDRLSDLTHNLESVLLRLKTHELQIDTGIINLLLQCSDRIGKILAELKQTGQSVGDDSDLQNIIQAVLLRAMSQPSVNDSKEIVFDMDVLNAYQSKNSELASRSSGFTPCEDDHKNQPEGHQKNQDEFVRVSLSRVDKLIDTVGELLIHQAVLDEHKPTLQSMLLQRTVASLSKISRELQDLSMGLRLVSLKPTFQKMQRIVRDTSQSLGKQVRLATLGDEVEVDRTILNQLSDPLVHLIRNAVDHGLESTAERLEKHKPAQGNISLSAIQKSDSIVIQIEDDGKGLDALKLREKAIEKGLIDAHKQLSDSECYKLIFLPGFSTKSEVSDISGRGVGLDVVRSNVEALKGRIDIKTVLGKGTTFSIVLPLSLSIIEAMLVRVGSNRFIVPLVQIAESIRPTIDQVSTAMGKDEILSLRGSSLPVHHLSQLLGLHAERANPWDASVIITGGDTDRCSIVVDEILCQQQIVTKALGDELQGLPGISGGAILADGRPTLILDLYELVNQHKTKSFSTLAS